MDKYNVPTNTYLYLLKTFDTLSFDILINKLDHYGIQGSPNTLLRRYLTGSIIVESQHNYPYQQEFHRGFVLGPLLFLVFINNLPHVSNLFKMLMYVNDTTLYCNIDQYVDFF